LIKGRSSNKFFLEQKRQISTKSCECTCKHPLFYVPVEFREDSDKRIDFIFEVQLLFEMHFIHSGLFLHHCLIAEVLDHFILELFLHPLQSFTSVLLIVISLLLFHFSVVVVDAILVEVFRRCHYVLFGSLFPFAFLHPLVVANFDRELRHFIFIEQSKDDT
jgi:hypothetical protein